MLQAGNRRPTAVERRGKDATGAKDPVLHFFIERYREAYDAALESLRSGKVVRLGARA
jgi:myo-inositol 2-dehydrogenase/D-chiro-inositol 1-dehydrogenase